jgi:dTDP-4-amino-4,6-dideoxygalactose transaminase
MAEIDRAGVPCQSGSCSEIYLEKAFQTMGYGPATALPAARELGETSLLFLIHPTFTQEDMDECASRIRRVLESATRPDAL